MAIKNIIARGIGFSPGAVEFIVTHGFIAGAVVIPSIWTPVAAASAIWAAITAASSIWTPETPASTTWTEE